NRLVLSKAYEILCQLQQGFQGRPCLPTIDVETHDDELADSVHYIQHDLPDKVYCGTEVLSSDTAEHNPASAVVAAAAAAAAAATVAFIVSHIFTPSRT
ncbi:hypothetical protein CHU98_g11576, partial [Xylaria longipes]